MTSPALPVPSPLAACMLGDNHRGLSHVPTQGSLSLRQTTAHSADLSCLRDGPH